MPWVGKSNERPNGGPVRVWFDGWPLRVPRQLKARELLTYYLWANFAENAPVTSSDDNPDEFVDPAEVQSCGDELAASDDLIVVLNYTTPAGECPHWSEYDPTLRLKWDDTIVTEDGRVYYLDFNAESLRKLKEMAEKSRMEDAMANQGEGI